MAYKNTLKGCFTMVPLEKAETKCNRKFFNKKSCKKEKRIYTLSNNEENVYKNLNDIDFEDLRKYLEKNYLNADKINKGNLVSDLATLKTYRDDLQLRILHIQILINSLPIFMSLISLVASEKILSLCIKHILMYAALCFASLGLAIFVIWNKKSQSPYKIKNMNNAIYILEEIRDNLRDKDEIPDSKDQDTKPDEQETETLDQEKVVSDSNTSETNIISSNQDSLKTSSIAMDLTIARDKGKSTVSIQDRHYKLSYSSETVSNACYTDELVDYVEENYTGIDTVDEGKLINDLILFKTMKYDLELDIKNDETFFSKIPILGIMDPQKIRNDRWSRNNRIKTINNIILVLEAIKEDIDSKKKN